MRKTIVGRRLTVGALAAVSMMLAVAGVATAAPATWTTTGTTAEWSYPGDPNPFGFTVNGLSFVTDSSRMAGNATNTGSPLQAKLTGNGNGATVNTQPQILWQANSITQVATKNNGVFTVTVTSPQINIGNSWGTSHTLNNAQFSGTWVNGVAGAPSTLTFAPNTTVTHSGFATAKVSGQLTIANRYLQ